MSFNSNWVVRSSERRDMRSLLIKGQIKISRIVRGAFYTCGGCRSSSTDSLNPISEFTVVSLKATEKGYLCKRCLDKPYELVR